MSDHSARDEVLVVKDESHQLPIPSAWRPVLRSIVQAFVERDYALSHGVPGVAPVSSKTAEQIEEYVEDYGEALIELPEQTWDTSVTQWMGDRWDILVDLWTEREGRSDLVLSARVVESGAGFEFHVHMVYVP